MVRPTATPHQRDAGLGLTQTEAAARLAADGPNELPRAGRRNLWRILAEVLREPMLALLLVGALAYLLFGDPQEALILAAFASFSVIVTVVQETRTERVLESLRDLTSPRALVLRDGARLRIPGREVVRGDVLILSEGDRIAADGWLIQATELMADESLLTGESIPVTKRATAALPDPLPRPGGNDGPLAFAGALVTRGQGLAVVHATGAGSEIGRIGQSLARLEPEPPRLRAQTLQIVRLFGIFGGIATAVAFILFGLTRGDWVEAALAGVALGMALLPEEFPVVLTVFMAMGAWRIARARVLTRRAAAIESLGSATVLCSDKTGTMTQNRMSVAEMHGHVAPFAFASEAFDGAALIGLLASAPQPFDPMDRAFHDLWAARGGGPLALKLVKTYGLRPDLLAVTQLWQPPEGGPLVAAAKGAPEAIARLCHMSPDALAELKAEVDRMAAQGLRVLGLAEADVPGLDPPPGPEALAFRFSGLVGLADPLRDQVPQAVADCRLAGIRVVMITGDYPATARAIAAQAGLDARRVLSGEDIATLPDAALDQALADTHVFARIMPEQKLRLVTALKARGEVVAMTGDGVNDAPSLKAAHIGIAMGGRGTDVAREAAAIVLLDDDFGSILKAIRLGRRIYDNLRKAMGFIMAVHLPIATLALLPLVLGQPLILLPVHIAFLEMIIDPVCSLVFEAEGEESNVMRRPPRDPASPLLSRPVLAWSLIQGLAAAGVAGGLYALALAQGLPADEQRSLVFLTLCLAIVALIFVNRSFSARLTRAFLRPNPALVWVPLLVGGGLSAIFLVPALAALFSFGPLHGHDLGLASAAALGMFLALEGVKLLLARALAR